MLGFKLQRLNKYCNSEIYVTWAICLEVCRLCRLHNKKSFSLPIAMKLHYTEKSS